jgi:hypothetical protein
MLIADIFGKIEVPLHTQKGASNHIYAHLYLYRVEHCNEPFVIFTTHTIVHPDAVVIEVLHTTVAFSAMF